MITRIIKEISKTNKVNLREFTTPCSDIRSFSKCISACEKNNLKVGEIESIFSVTLNSSVQESIVVDFYSNAHELLTSLICITVEEKEALMGVKYFKTLLDTFEKDGEETGELLKDIHAFFVNVANSEMLDLDICLLENKEIIKKMLSVIDKYLPVISRQCYSNIDGDYNDIKLFAKEILVNIISDTPDITVVSRGTYCTGLFNCDSVDMTDSKIEEKAIRSLFKSISSLGTKPFLDIPYLNTYNRNSIYFSIILLECINHVIERVMTGE